MVKLDLHGYYHDNAQRLLETTLNSMWCTEEELHIITGNSPKLQKIVIDILDEYGLSYIIGDFSGQNMGFVKTILE